MRMSWQSTLRLASYWTLMWSVLWTALLRVSQIVCAPLASIALLSIIVHQYCTACLDSNARVQSDGGSLLGKAYLMSDCVCADGSFMATDAPAATAVAQPTEEALHKVGISLSRAPYYACSSHGHLLSQALLVSPEGHALQMWACPGINARSEDTCRCCNAQSIGQKSSVHCLCSCPWRESRRALRRRAAS